MDSNNVYNQGYALIISVNENAEAHLALADVKKDVDSLQEVLTHPQRCAYPPEQVKVLSGQDATRQNILVKIENGDFVGGNKTTYFDQRGQKVDKQRNIINGK